MNRIKVKVMGDFEINHTKIRNEYCDSKIDHLTFGLTGPKVLHYL